MPEVVFDADSITVYTSKLAVYLGDSKLIDIYEGEIPLPYTAVGWSGWLSVTDECDTEQLLYVEPRGTGWKMLQTELFYVYVNESREGLPEIVSLNDGIQLFTSDVVIRYNGSILFDDSDGKIPPPPPTPSGFPPPPPLPDGVWNAQNASSESS